MNIPTNIPRRINKSVNNVESLSVVYIPQEDKHIYEDDGSILIRFPYSKNTFWTNFKYSCLNQNNIKLKTELIIKTSNDHMYTVLTINETEQNQWHDTKWAIPSVNTIDHDAGIYLKLYNCRDLPKYTIRISILGFLHIYPDVIQYFLLSQQNTYLFIFNTCVKDESIAIKRERERERKRNGSIYSIEQTEHMYTSHNSYGIRLIDSY